MKKIRLLKPDGTIIGTIRSQVLNEMLYNNFKTVASLTSFYNFLVYNDLQKLFPRDFPKLQLFLAASSGTAKHKKYFKALKPSLCVSFSLLPSMSIEEKVLIYYHHCKMFDFYINNPTQITSKTPSSSVLTFEQLLDKVKADPKAYIPAYHEDYVYSDANWSPRDAHL